MLNKDTEPWNGGYALTGKRKARLAISLFGTLFLVFFGVGFLMFRPHGIRGVLWLAVGVIVVFAVSIALGEAGSFLGRKLREWTERMERATSSLRVRTADRHVSRTQEKELYEIEEKLEKHPDEKASEDAAEEASKKLKDGRTRSPYVESGQV